MIKSLIAAGCVLVCCLGNEYPATADDGITYEIDAYEMAWYQCDNGDQAACEFAKGLE